MAPLLLIALLVLLAWLFVLIAASAWDGPDARDGLTPRDSSRCGFVFGMLDMFLILVIWRLGQVLIAGPPTP